ncbi:ABC transporter permease [Ruoffia sp. FAM 20857]|uniref:ABC transporter permease n=1 Tax=Ruoffia sp. FAM 20857 TaxID=3259515 RepID=UPI0038846C4E
MMTFLQENGSQLVTLIFEHLSISFISLLLGIIVAVPLGVVLTRTPKAADFVIGIASIFQTVPTLALLALMIPLIGIGRFPAIIALFIYSLLPILRNTYIGMNDVSPTAKDAAKGMGMTALQSITKVELPLAMPVIMAGIRLSAVYVIAWTSLASYIGAGGLGDFILSGISLYEADLIFAGTIPVTIMALLADYLLGKVEIYFTPDVTAAK